MNAGLRVAATGAILLTLSACGGGSTAPAPSTRNAASSGKVSVTLHYPTNVHYATQAASAVGRAPLYVNPTPGAVITVTDNGATVVSDTFVNPQADGTQTIQIPVVGGVGTDVQNDIVVSEYAQGSPDTTLLSQGSTTIYFTAGDDLSYSLAMQMNAVGAAITPYVNSQGTVLSTNSGTYTQTYIGSCNSTTIFFVYATDPTNAFVTSAYTGVPQVTLYAQTGSPAGSFVTVLPTGGFQVTTSYNGGYDNVTFVETSPLTGDTVYTYATLGSGGC